MKYLKIFIFAVFTLLCVSCSITRRGSYMPVTSQLNIQMSDLEYLGETEISIEYRTYLGIIRVVDKVNGEEYDISRKQFATMNAGASDAPGIYSTLKKASYKVLEEYPDANYFIVVRTQRNVDRLFLGSEKIDRAIVKAYSLRK